MCSLMGIRHAKSVTYLRRSNGRGKVARRQLFQKLRKIHLTNKRRNWFEETWPALKAHHDTPTPGGLSPHQILLCGDPLWRGLPLSCDDMAPHAKEFLRGKRLRRGRFPSSSRRSMPCEPRPPRSPQRISSGWVTRCGAATHEHSPHQDLVHTRRGGPQDW